MSLKLTDSFKANIAVPIGNLKPLMEWCEKNCISEWQFDYGTINRDDGKEEYEFFFESEKDYVGFLVFKR